MRVLIYRILKILFRFSSCNFLTGLSKLQAVSDQQKLFDGLRQMFAKRLNDHLITVFTKQVGFTAFYKNFQSAKNLNLS